ncbi:MAG: pyridoxal-dependent decarboxylase, exosortase A system-associated [Gammaproteobacteria bacterium]|nr:MAG: pyridoxal-dependent decarboxylase, exosortase A system-associated [Gammaproteobacteria bacterium]
MSRHPALRHHRIIDGELHLGGHPVRHWVAQHGTPLYLYDGRLITERVAALRSALPDGISLHYAVKANPMPELVKLLATLVDGMDVASADELERALATGLADTDISFAGPGKRDEELVLALQSGVLLVVESEGELGRLLRIADQLGKTPPIALRINPAFRLRASGMHMGGGPSPFGIDEERIPTLLREIATLPVDLMGFHVFAGSQNLSAEYLIAAQTAIFERIQRLLPDFPGELRWLNIGGGLGIPYFPGERPLELAPLAEALATHQEMLRRLAPNCELVMELGRYLVGEAGVYVARIVDRKQSRGKVYLVTDGGMHQHLAASGNLGQVLRRNYPVIAPEYMDRPAEEKVTIVGPLCTPLDVLATDIEMPRLQVGDLVAVLQSGAYGYSASPLGFLGHPPPVERLL